MDSINKVQSGMKQLDRLLTVYESVEYPAEFPHLANDLRKLIIDVAKLLWQESKDIPKIND